MTGRANVVEQRVKQKKKKHWKASKFRKVRWFSQGYISIKVKDWSMWKAAVFFFNIILISLSSSYPSHTTHLILFPVFPPLLPYHASFQPHP